MRHSIAFLCIAAAVAACAPAPEVVEVPEPEPEPVEAPVEPEPEVVEGPVEFDPAEVAFINRKGGNTIRGEAYIAKRRGGRATCSGASVHLIPAGRYSRQWIRGIYGTLDEPAMYGTTQIAVQGSLLFTENVDPGFLKNMQRTHCDSNGGFTFGGLADGGYFVITAVTWEVRSTYAGRVMVHAQGGSVMAPVAVRGGEVANLVISP